MGDSLTVGTAPLLGPELAELGCTLRWWDAAVGRRTSEGVAVLEANRSRLPRVIVVGLGTNDRYELADFAAHVDRVMVLAAGRQVVWSDVAYEPVRDHVNLVLYLKALVHPNLWLTGWDRPYWSNTRWRAADGVHATPAGYRARAELVAGDVRHAVDHATTVPK